MMISVQILSAVEGGPPRRIVVITRDGMEIMYICLFDGGKVITTIISVQTIWSIIFQAIHFMAITIQR